MSATIRTQEEIAARVKALESMLIEQGVMTTQAIDRLVEIYEHEVGPQLGARVVAKAWSDPDFKARLIEDATEACQELGISGLQGEDMVVLENTDTRPQHHRLHPLLLLSLARPGPATELVQGPPVPRRHHPRAAQGPGEAFGFTVPEDVEVRVWDSSSEMRYWVLPQRPAGTEDWTEDQLVDAGHA